MSQIAKKPSKVCVYYRVSTQGQADDDRNGLDVQTKACDRYALSLYKMKESCINYYCDIGSSYNNKCILRDQNLMVRHIYPGTVILIYNVSRLGRNIDQVMKLLIKIKKMKGQVISVTENICYGKTRLQDKKFLYRVIESEEKSDYKSDRTTKYIQLIKDMGGHIGRPSYGYSVQKINGIPKLIKNIQEQKVIKDIKKYKIQYKSSGEIAIILNRKKILKKGNMWTNLTVDSVKLNILKTTKVKSNLENSMSSLSV